MTSEVTYPQAPERKRLGLKEQGTNRVVPGSAGVPAGIGSTADEDVGAPSKGVPAGIGSIADEDVGAPSNGVPAGNSSIAD